MTDNLNHIYKILRALETAMDYPEFDITQISSEKLGVTPERWARYIEMMCDAGYIKGSRITLKGLEYLSENAIMQRMYKAAKGIKELI